MQPRTDILAEAQFDPKLKLYWVLPGYLVLLLSVVGIVLMPVWAFVGPWWAQRYFESLACLLTERSLIVKKGWLFRTEKTIPLDKIQDVALKEGPLLRRLGLAKLDVETAGQTSQGQAEAALVGVMDVYDFRDRVLAQRDALEAHRGQRLQAAPEHRDGDARIVPVLVEIRDSLRRVEEHLRSQAPAADQEERRH